MFAVVRTGGKQYRVHPGDKIVVEKLDGSAGDKITLNDVLLAGEGANFKATPGLTVDAEIVAQAKGEKVTVFKKRRRHNYRRKAGHRQQHTILKIVAIGDHKEQKPASSKAEGKAAPKVERKAAPPSEAAPATAAQASQKPAATAKEKAKVETSQQESGDIAGKPTENPAPENEAQANPQTKGDIEVTPKNAARAKKATAGGKPAKAASTENAAPAKAAAKKTPKAK